MILNSWETEGIPWRDFVKKKDDLDIEMFRFGAKHLKNGFTNKQLQDHLRREEIEDAFEDEDHWSQAYRICLVSYFSDIKPHGRDHLYTLIPSGLSLLREHDKKHEEQETQNRNVLSAIFGIMISAIGILASLYK